MVNARVAGLCAGALLLATSCQREQRLFRVTPWTARRRIPEDNAYAVAEGQRLFEGFNCVGCHAHGGGGIGPALMDDEWIHGHEPEVIFTVISEGTPNGMPAFRGKLPPAQRWQLVAYVRSLSGLVPAAAVPVRSDHLQARTSAPPRKAVPGRELLEMRVAEDAELHSYGWVDRSAGVARIPIDRAIELAAGHGLPGRTPAISRHR
jgi:mono/diheme cytochrome c family protein